MDLSFYGDKFAFFRCRISRATWQRIEAKYENVPDACKALRLELEAAAERLAASSRAAPEHASSDSWGH